MAHGIGRGYQTVIRAENAQGIRSEKAHAMVMGCFHQLTLERGSLWARLRKSLGGHNGGLDALPTALLYDGEYRWAA